MRRRDIGGGLIAERPGAPAASATLSGAFGLAWRLQRATLLAWTIGLWLYGPADRQCGGQHRRHVGGSSTISDIVSRLGGSQALEDAFITISFSFLAVAAAAMAISSTLRLHQEESILRAKPFWLVLSAGSVGPQVISSLPSPGRRWRFWPRVWSRDSPTGSPAVTSAGVPAVVAVAALQLPAIWMLCAITVALFGLVPRFTPVAWGVLVAFIALYLLGSLAGLPHWLINLQPFTHAQQTPGQPFDATPVLWLLLIDVVLLAVGLLAFRRRDLR